MTKELMKLFFITAIKESPSLMRSYLKYFATYEYIAFAVGE